MQIPFVDLRQQHLSLLSDLQSLVGELLATNVVMGGQAIEQFEDDFSDYLGVDYALCCANATDAIEIVLRAWEIQPGDEVIVPANGWVSAAEAVLLLGATPVFVDNRADNYNLNVERLYSKITSRTRAIVPIHLYGEPADLPAITKIARSAGIYVLEDCAQAHGAVVAGKKVGSWGDAAIFSFYPTKNLGALGDGGIVVTNNQKLAVRCRAIANHGQLYKHTHQLLGRNSRMDALQARILSLKLPFLDKWNDRRKQIAHHYLKNWSDLPVVLPPGNDNSVWHLFVVRVDQRETVRNQLLKQGISTEVHYPVPVCQQPILKKYRAVEGYQNAENQAHQLLSIPVYPELSNEQVGYIEQQFRRAIVAAIK